MPPKKGAKAPEPAPIVPVDGAKFCYVVCGGKDSELKITVNTNCRTDILVDYIRQEFLRLAAVRTLELKALAALPDTPPSNAEMLQKWSELQTILSNTVFNTIDLNDEAGACLNCKTNYPRIACEYLAHSSTTYMAVLDESNTLKPIVW